MAHEFLTVKFRFKLKKVGKTSSPFKYDLNQILWDYTVEVTNRFKGLDLVECLNIYGWRFITGGYGGFFYFYQNHTKEKEMQEGKVVV